MSSDSFDKVDMNKEFIIPEVLNIIFQSSLLLWQMWIEHGAKYGFFYDWAAQDSIVNWKIYVNGKHCIDEPKSSFL